MVGEKLNINPRIAGHQWGVQLQREIDVLIKATEGRGASTLFLALATEAIIADTGRLEDSTGTVGYAWQPKVYEKERDPVTSRIRAAGASIGRVMAGGHPSHRCYLAVLEAVYVVTTQQEYDVAERIEKLWDEARANADISDQEQLEAKARPRRSLWRRFLNWLWPEEVR